MYILHFYHNSLNFSIYNGNLLSGSAYGSASTLVDYGNTIFLNDNVAHTVSTDMFRLLEKYLENDYDISY